MNVKQKFHFPVPVLTLESGYVLAAVGAHRTELGERVEDADIATATALCASLKGDVQKQQSKIADTGMLTEAQNKLLASLKDWMHRARETGKKAFAQDAVKLHSEFQVGVEVNSLASTLASAGIIAAACAKTENVAPLKAKGWVAADTTAFAKVITDLGGTDATQEASKTEKTKVTGDRNADANALFDLVIGFQNAGNLQFPASNPANGPVRAEFRLGLFPPDHGNKKKAATPPVTPPTPTK